MRPITDTYSPVTTSAAGLANDVAYSGGGYALTANSAGDGLAHLIIILGNAATDHSGKTFTITGTDADGKAQTEDLAGPNGNVTITSTKYFKTVTAVTVSATTGADTFDIGWNVGAVSKTIPLNWRATQFNVALSVDISGTINFDVEQTEKEIYGSTVPSALTWTNHATIVNKTADIVSNLTSPSRAVRLSINSVTNGATIALSVIQSG